MANLKNCKINIYHHGNFNTMDTFMPLVEDFVNYLPELQPDVWDVVEPIKRVFDVTSIETEMTRWGIKDVGWCDFMWRRKGKPKAWGTFGKMTWYPKPRHASQYIDLDLPPQLEPRLLEYLKHASIKFNADFAVFNCKLSSFESQSHYEAWQVSSGQQLVCLRSYDMQEHLPAIYWSQVFGAPYVRLFGLEKLLSAPAYKVEQLGSEMVYIQLTETLFDVLERYEHVDAVRQKVKAHLDDNILFNPNNSAAHVYRVPDFEFPQVPA